MSRQSLESDYAAADAGSLGVSPTSGTTSGSTDQGYTEADAGSLGLARTESAANAKAANDYADADAGSLGIAQPNPTTVKTIQESLAAIARNQ